MNIDVTEEGILIDGKGKDVEMNNGRKMRGRGREEVKVVRGKVVGLWLRGGVRWGLRK